MENRDKSIENRDNSITVNVKLEKEDAGEFSAIILKSKMKFRKWQLRLLIITVIIFTIILLYSLFIEGGTSDWTSSTSIVEPVDKVSNWPIVALSLIILFRIGLPILTKAIAKKQFESNKQLQKETEYTLSSEGISAHSESKMVNLKWEEVFKIIETKQYFAILESTQAANLIPKRCFKSEDDMFLAATLMQDKMPGKKFELLQGF